MKIRGYMQEEEHLLHRCREEAVTTHRRPSHEMICPTVSRHASPCLSMDIISYTTTRELSLFMKNRRIPYRGSYYFSCHKRLINLTPCAQLPDIICPSAPILRDTRYTKSKNKGYPKKLLPLWSGGQGTTTARKFNASDSNHRFRATEKIWQQIRRSKVLRGGPLYLHFKFVRFRRTDEVTHTVQYNITYDGWSDALCTV